jgi:hypothetical protein
MTVDLTTQPLRIAIVGGGPGGLATAIALQKIPNVDVALYEQASELREVGAGISIGANSWKVLELLGVADSVDTGHETWTVLNLYAPTTSTENFYGAVVSELELTRRTAATGDRARKCTAERSPGAPLDDRRSARRERNCRLRCSQLLRPAPSSWLRNSCIWRIVERRVYPSRLKTGRPAPSISLSARMAYALYNFPYAHFTDT